MGDDCQHETTRNVSTERKTRPERAGNPPYVTVCEDCGEVL